MARRVADHIHWEAERSLVGRTRELRALEACLTRDAPRVVHVHGIPGVGKSHLLSAFVARASVAAADNTVIQIDCRSAEPTPRGFLGELRSLLASRARSHAKLAEDLGQAGEHVLLVLDAYELFRLLDTWLRQDFVPALPDNVRVVLAARQKPSAGWLSDPGWRGLFQSIQLGPLGESDSLRLLEQAGVKREAANRVLRFTHGHPLALQLAVAALNERPGLRFEGLAIQGVLEELTRMFLADVSDPVTRRLLVGVSVLRRVTLPLLEALFPEIPAQEAHDRLAALPFTDATRDGLMLHDAVRSALARSLRARDPSDCLARRRAAWQRLSQELAGAAGSELWRYTADLLYLIENPVVREAFFPSGESWLQVEPARRDDMERVRDIVERHEGVGAGADLLRLWDQLPEAFSVVRGEDLECLGFYVAFDPADVEPALLASDPVSSSWLEHLRANPIPEGQRALFIRRWLSAEAGEAPSEVQAACWLDLKRSYLEMRPQLQRAYLTLADPGPYAAVVTELGFVLPAEMSVKRDGVIHHGAVLDFGPGSVDGWLAGLLAVEIGAVAVAPELDEEARELLVEGRRHPLTRLEFGVIQYLLQRPGKAVSRTSLLNDVWGLSYEGGSNVVDTVVVALRRKLGDWSRVVETVTGTGYRYRPPA